MQCSAVQFIVMLNFSKSASGGQQRVAILPEVFWQKEVFWQEVFWHLDEKERQAHAALLQYKDGKGRLVMTLYDTSNPLFSLQTAHWKSTQHNADLSYLILCPGWSAGTLCRSWDLSRGWHQKRFLQISEDLWRPWPECLLWQSGYGLGWRVPGEAWERSKCILWR